MNSASPRINGNGSATPSTLAAFRDSKQIASSNGKSPNNLALPRRPSARRPRHGRILFVTDFYLEELLVGVADYAHQAGWELNANMRFHGLLPSDTKADGILATAVREPRVRDWIAGWKNCPVVRMICTRFDLPYPAVEVDYAAAGRAGARHLLGLGHVHYAFYSAGDGADTCEVRDGFEAELRAGGRRSYRLDFAAGRPAGYPIRSERETRCRWLAKQLPRLPRPVAIMGDDDRRALEVLTACDFAGLRVPEDVAILGCDNHLIEQKLSRLALSSVDVNLKGVGWEASALLDRMMQGAAPASAVLKVPPQGVVARRSTATFVTDSPGITAAVLYVREHYPEPVRLAQLARLSGLSKRTFETEFKRRVGRTVREELQRVRLECAARLLRDTNLKLSAVAVESGLGSASRLCRTFFEANGTTPNVWREKARKSA